MGRCCVRLTIRFIYKAPEVSVTGISPGLQKLHLQAGVYILQKGDILSPKPKKNKKNTFYLFGPLPPPGTFWGPFAKKGHFLGPYPSY